MDFFKRKKHTNISSWLSHDRHCRIAAVLYIVAINLSNLNFNSIYHSSSSQLWHSKVLIAIQCVHFAEVLKEML